VKLKEVKLQNFRGYKNEVTVSFENLAVLIGRNDAGKSSILDALNIFFNDAEIQKEDACVHGNTTDVRISCVFSDLPTQIVLDELHPTTLQQEYLVRQDGLLEVCRIFNCNTAKGKAEDAAHSRKTGAIYAIEEPETSQHPNHQLMLLDAFQELTDQDLAQVILTTHTPTLARKVDRNSIRLVALDAAHPKILLGSEDATLQSIKATLGVLPDHDVKVFVGVEGKWDIEFLTRMSKIINAVDATVPDLKAAESSGALVFIPLGGSSMELWTSRLAGLDRPEFYITDRDKAPPAQPKYHRQIAGWNARANCAAYSTTKKELENYLHPDAIKTIALTFPNVIADFDDVPLLLAQTLHTADANAPAWNTVPDETKKEKASKAKRRLNMECADAMTYARLAQSDPNGEIISWLKAIGAKLA
jgi:putative ATP-dependent endonuclease of the OLD family